MQTELTIMQRLFIRVFSQLAVLGLLALAAACGNPPADLARSASGSSAADSRVAPLARAPLVKPPFEVKGDADGLLLVWYDEHGEAHPASQRAEIPEARRESVRVDALELAPEQRLDPAFVYVADLREATKDGQYAVRKVGREAFESSLASQPAQPERVAQAVGSDSKDVIIYGASWCGACKQAARFFTQKGVAFVEKDIEKEPGARSEMMAKAKSQGVRTGGIPVIDVRGTLLGGFNAQRIEQLLASN
jgi:glutaredoxin